MCCVYPGLPASDAGRSALQGLFILFILFLTVEAAPWLRMDKLLRLRWNRGRNRNCEEKRGTAGLFLFAAKELLPRQPVR
jgi:hypothetical protein